MFHCLEPSGESSKVGGIERKFTFRPKSIEIIRDSDMMGRWRENIGKPAAFEKLVSAGIVKRRVFDGHYVTTAD